MENYKIMQYIRSVKQNPQNIKKIDKETLIEYPQICFELINSFPNGIKYIPINIREEMPQLCIDAVEANPENIKYVPEQVQIENYQMCIEAVKKEKGLLYYISIDLLEEHPEICLEALLRDKECIEDIPEEIIESNPQIQAMLDIMEDWKKIDDLPIEMLRKNPQLCIAASLTSQKKYQPSEELLLNNSELVEKYVKEWEKLATPSEMKYIVATKDSKYIRNCIKNKEKYFIYYRTYNSAIYGLVKALGGNEQETIMELLGQRDEYNLTYDEIVSLISQTRDVNFIRSIIDKREEYEFPSDYVALLIRNTNDREFIKQCINQSETYELDRKDADGLVKYTNDISFVLNYVQENPITDSARKKIKLPKGITIGMEIESEGDASVELLHRKKVLDGWETKTDKSLENGVEVTSPVLRSENSIEKEIYDICSILKLCGNYTSRRCGGHVHIGADYLKSIDAWKNLVEIWSNAENILYLISNKKGEKPREEFEIHAMPISGNIADAIEEGEVNFEDEDDITEFCEKLKKLQGIKGSRYSGINFQNFGNKDKNTIEFRISNGTLEPDTWIENINLYGGIIAISQELADIQEKIENGIELTDEEQKKIDAFEKIRESYSEKQKLACLLYLAVDEKERQIYLDRYYENKREMYGFRVIRDAGHIRINRKKIGKIAFTGDTRVTGEEYQQGSIIIQSELDKEKENTIKHDISK